MMNQKTMSGATALLLTKLRLAALPDAYVPRPALCAQLAATLSIRLTLISAPPGFGKTTLLAEWLDKVGRVSVTAQPRVAWLTLDPGDNDPVRFLRYLLAAIQTAAPGIGAGVAGLLDAPQPRTLESVLAPCLTSWAS